MAYIGKSPITGRFDRLDDISSSFNDSTTTFNLLKGGVAIDPLEPEQLIVSVDGVIQQPRSAFTISGSQISFTEAPNNNATFFAIALGETGTVFTPSVTPESITATQLATDAVETAKIKDINVTAGKLATDAVETDKIKNLNVTAGKLATDAVETAKIKDLNVTTGKIADTNITTAKIAADAVTSLKISPNTVMRGKTIFDAAVQERSNVIASNIVPAIINIDPLNNSILFYTANSHDNSAHTVNFINLEGVEVGNTVSFVVAVTNNTNTFANINAVQVNGEACAGHERTATSNNLFISGGLKPTGSANIDVYSFNVQKVQTSSYTVFLSKTNFS